MRHNYDDAPDVADLCSEPGARRLAARLRDYWIARGYRGISTGIVRREIPKQKRRGDDVAIYGIVSNIGFNGFPPRYLFRGARVFRSVERFFGATFAKN